MASNQLTRGGAKVGSLTVGGNTLTGAEFAALDGVTAGTGAASKALILDASGNITIPDGGYISLSVAAVAAAGSGQSTFTVIADQVNAVTGADGTKGVALPAASAGRAILIINTDQSNVLKVAPVNGGNDQINSLTAGTGVLSVGPARAAWFVPTSATQWYVTGDAAVVATPTELDYVNVATAGAAEASKALVLDSNGDVDIVRYFKPSNATPAAAGSAQADATALAAMVNAVTAADNAKGVALPAAADGLDIWVINTVGTASLKVYPVNGGNDQINSLSANAAFTLGPGKAARFHATSATQWYTDENSAEEQTVLYATVTLTNAQVLALRAAPITVIAAPGAGKFIEVLSGVLIFNRTAGYTETADNLQLKYVNGTGSVASQLIECTGFVDAAGDAIINVLPNAINALITAAGELSNALVCIHNTGDGEFGGGDAANTIKVCVAYRVHTTGL